MEKGGWGDIILGLKSSISKDLSIYESLHSDRSLEFLDLSPKNESPSFIWMVIGVGVAFLHKFQERMTFVGSPFATMKGLGFEFEK